MVKATQLAEARRRPSAPDGGNAAQNGDDGDAGPLLPFVASTRERVEQFHDRTDQIESSAQQVVSSVDIPAIGFLRYLVLEVTATGGDGSTTNAVASQDAPFNALQQLQVADVNGDPIIHPMSGYLAYLYEKYGAYSFVSDARQKPSFSDVNTDGDFTFVLRVPLEVSGRDGLGALENMNASQTFKLSYSVAAGSTIYDTEPNTLPSLRVRARMEVWTQPQASSVTGRPQEQEPPNNGATQFAALSTYNIASGEQVIRHGRVGNIVRTLILILLDGSQQRTDADWPDPVRLNYDGTLLVNYSDRYFRDLMAERYGFVHGAVDAAGGLDTGVRVFEWSHDLDGKPGFEDRQLYLHTTQATRLEFDGSFGSNADQLQVITNDIAVPA